MGKLLYSLSLFQYLSTALFVLVPAYPGICVSTASMDGGENVASMLPRKNWVSHWVGATADDTSTKPPYPSTVNKKDAQVTPQNQGTPNRYACFNCSREISLLF